MAKEVNMPALLADIQQMIIDAANEHRVWQQPVFVVTSWSALLDCHASCIMMSANASHLPGMIDKDHPYLSLSIILSIIRNDRSHQLSKQCSSILLITDCSMTLFTSCTTMIDTLFVSVT
jgi:hypothetical protein